MFEKWESMWPSFFETVNGESDIIKIYCKFSKNKIILTYLTFKCSEEQDIFNANEQAMRILNTLPGENEGVADHTEMDIDH